MGSNGPDEVMVAALDEAECSETTVEIKIKTLDSQTYTLRVNKCVPVPELKEQIEIITGVLSDQQRLICRGKVLKDDQLLSAYHVEDGHTLHLVVRQPMPPSSTPTTGMGSESLPDHSGNDHATGSGQNGGNHVSHRVLLGSFNIAEQGDGSISDLNRIISAVLSSIGITNVGSSTEGTEAMEPGPGRVERTSGSGVTSDSTQPHLDQPTSGAQFDPLHGAFRIPSPATLGTLQPPVIPDSLATLLQYLTLLRHEFAVIGGTQASLNADRQPTVISNSGAGQAGLPTAASLAQVIQSTRQLLIEQVGEHLSQLSRQLEDQINVSSLSMRNSIQSSAIRTGIALQNLGALLLELGRTTMTLRMGQTPSDAVVNAGPAVFISTSGPNPIMVQPLQPGVGFSGSSMGTINAGSGLLGGTLGSGLFPRNIDIRIRSGPSVSSSNVNQGEQAGALQNPVQTGPERTSNAAGSVHQQGQGVQGGSTFTREAAVRVLPIRTVVAALPGSLGRSTSTSPGGSVGLFYPLIARYQPGTSRQSNDARGAAPSEHHPSVPGADYQQNTDSMQQNVPIDAPTTNGASHNPVLRSRDAVDSDNNNGQSGQHRNSQESARHIFRPDELPTGSVNTGAGNTVGANNNETTPRLGINDGIYLSRLLHQIIPVVSQNVGTEPTDGLDGATASQDLSQQTTQTEDQSCVGASHPRDGCPPSPSSSKRQKRE